MRWQFRLLRRVCQGVGSWAAGWASGGENTHCTVCVFCCYFFLAAYVEMCFTACMHTSSIAMHDICHTTYDVSLICQGHSWVRWLSSPQASTYMTRGEHDMLPLVVCLSSVGPWGSWSNFLLRSFIKSISIFVFFEKIMMVILLWFCCMVYVFFTEKNY